jgi:hypothetical protein
MARIPAFSDGARLNQDIILEDTYGIRHATETTTKKIVANLHTATAEGSTLASSTTETMLLQFILPANSLKNAGDSLRILAQGIAPSTNSSDTLIVRIRIGPATTTPVANRTLLAATTVLDATNDDIFVLDATLVARAAASAASSCVGLGMANFGVAGTTTTRAQSLAATNFVTNGALVISVTGQWSVSHANNQCAAQMLIVDLVR